MVRSIAGHVLVVVAGVLMGPLSAIPALAQGETWTISATPQLSIGREASGPMSDLSSVRGAARLSSGRIVIGDQLGRLFLLDESGRHLRTFGGRGTGPGQFSQLRSVQRTAGDTILVGDVGNGGRVSYFSPEGEFLRSMNTSAYPSPLFFGAFPDGSAIFGRVFDAGTARPSSSAVTFQALGAELSRVGRDGSLLNSIASVPYTDVAYVPGIGPAMMNGFSDTPGRRTVIATGNGRIYLATGWPYEIRVFSPEGQSLAVIERDAGSTPLTRDHLVEFFTTNFAVWSDVDWAAARWNIPEARALPAITGLRVDQSGNLWVHEGGAEPTRRDAWQVFTESGGELARATMDPSFQPFDIGADWVLGVWKDESDVERVQLRPIIKR